MDSRRIASGIASAASTAVALPTAVGLMLDDALNQTIGWSIVVVAAVVAVISGAYAAWGRVPLISAFLRAPSEKWVPLSDAAHYLANDSAWSRRRDFSDPHKWVSDLRRDLKDALGSGEIAARGRRCEGNNAVSRRGAEPIEASIWPESILLVLAKYPPKEQCLVAIGAEWGFADVAVSGPDLRRHWPPLRFWERHKVKPTDQLPKEFQG